MLTLLTTSLLLNLFSKLVEVPKIEPIEILLDKLAICEFDNRSDAINIMDGDASSFGAYQFKIKTFVHFGRRYGLPHDDIWSSEQQRAIAKEMLLEQRWKHWYNCYKKITFK